MNSRAKFEELLEAELDERKKLREASQKVNTDWVSNDTSPKHYSNENGSLYKIGLERGWNCYQFDAIKRIDRAYKKGKFEEDIEKTKLVLELMKYGK
jgi:hypothetical protein